MGDVEKRKSKVTRGTARVVLEERMIENPLATDGVVVAALDAGEEQPRWSRVIVNKVTTVGGLARMKGLSGTQLAAAGRYRVLSEVAMMDAARGTDYAAVRVDVSGGGRDMALDGAAARRELAIARRTIGPFYASLLDQIVCEERSVRDLAQGGNARLLTNRRVREALDVLVEHFGRGRPRVRREGDAATDWSLPEDGDGAQKPH
jgi:hypothetical protein